MTDPTIPELVARLRELYREARLTDALHVACDAGDPCAIASEDADIDVYSEDFGRGKALALLIVEAANALPTLLDALERQGSLRSGIEQLIHELDNEGWDSSGSEAERKARIQALDLCQAKLRAVLDALDHVGDANKMVAPSPDGGKVLDCDHCGTPCIPTCVACGETYSTTAEAAACEDAGFRSPRAPGTWRPISEPPSAEVHAWCGGRYLFEDKHGGVFQENHIRQAFELLGKHSSVFIRYLPIPPSNERRG